MQVGGKLLVATTGGSPLKPSEVALLEVDSVEALAASTPEQWLVLQRSSKAQVRAAMARVAIYTHGMLCSALLFGLCLLESS